MREGMWNIYICFIFFYGTTSQHPSTSFYICLSQKFFLDFSQIIYFHVYIYIYILTNLLSTSIHGDIEKEKKNAKIQIYKISNHLSGVKKKKEKANFVTPVEKNQEICHQLVKRTKTQRKMLQCYNYKKCSILNRANYKN